MVTALPRRVLRAQRRLGAPPRVLRKLIRPGASVLVVGEQGHVGCAALALRIAALGRVSFHHPDPEVNQKLARRASRLGYRDRVTIHQQLVDADDRVQLLVAPPASRSRTRLSRWWHKLIDAHRPDAATATPQRIAGLLAELRPEVVVLDVGTPNLGLLAQLGAAEPPTSEMAGASAPVIVIVAEGPDIAQSATAINDAGLLTRDYTLKAGLDLLVMVPTAEIQDPPRNGATSQSPPP